jgi:Ca2+-binding RTX toxin-like protein
VIVGRAGDDTVAGVDEYDTVCSGEGDDTIRVHAGEGDLDGGQGNDYVGRTLDREPRTRRGPVRQV